MPNVHVVFYVESGVAPALEWLAEQPDKVQDKFYWLLEQLELNGHALRRPYADVLRDKIYELRARHQHVNYRLLYFFDGQSAVVLAHGCTKEGAVDRSDIDRAVARRAAYMKDRARHTYTADEMD